MKLSTAQINSFLEKPDPSARVVLIYGPDAGLVKERADIIAKMTVPDVQDPFRTTSLTPSALSDDPARLHDEMASQSLGGGRRLVRLIAATDSTSHAVDALIKDMPQSDSLLLIEAGDLEKRSKLRAVCENANAGIAIPCYVEEGPAKARIISDILATEKLRITKEALAFLTDILPPDRMAMRSELDKLAMYCRVGGAAEQPPSITVEDVQAIVQDAGAAEMDDLIFAVGIGDTKRAGILLDRLMEEQTSIVAVLRAAQRHFLRLQWARGQMDTGAGAGEAVKRLQPPVFWKFQEPMAAQLRRWPRTKIDAALTRLYEAEALVKRTGTPDQALCAQLLLGLAA